MGPFELHAGYTLLVVIGFALTVAFPVTSHFARVEDRRRYWVLQGITVVSAMVGAKVAVVLGDALWPLRPFDDWWALLGSGRSVVGALLFGFLGAEAAKPFLAYDIAVGSLGPFDRIFNTPSNHRIHHSRAPEHRDKNMGAMLMLWDHLFKTYAPETVPLDYGIPDAEPPRTALALYIDPWKRALSGEARERADASRGEGGGVGRSAS